MLALHGNMSPEKRDAVVTDFASGKVQLLITSTMLTLLRDSLQCQQVMNCNALIYCGVTVVLCS